MKKNVAFIASIIFFPFSYLCGMDDHHRDVLAIKIGPRNCCKLFGLVSPQKSLAKVEQQAVNGELLLFLWTNYCEDITVDDVRHRVEIHGAQIGKRVSLGEIEEEYPICCLCTLENNYYCTIAHTCSPEVPLSLSFGKGDQLAFERVKYLLKLGADPYGFADILDHPMVLNAAAASRYDICFLNLLLEFGGVKPYTMVSKKSFVWSQQNLLFNVHTPLADYFNQNPFRDDLNQRFQYDAVRLLLTYGDRFFANHDWPGFTLIKVTDPAKKREVLNAVELLFFSSRTTPKDFYNLSELKDEIQNIYLQALAKREVVKWKVRNCVMQTDNVLQISPITHSDTIAAIELMQNYSVKERLKELQENNELHMTISLENEVLKQLILWQASQCPDASIQQCLQGEAYDPGSKSWVPGKTRLIDPNMVGPDNKSPVQHAVEVGNVALVQELTQCSMMIDKRLSAALSNFIEKRLSSSVLGSERNKYQKIKHLLCAYM